MFIDPIDRALRLSLNGLISLPLDRSNEIEVRLDPAEMKPVQAVVETPEEQFKKQEYPSIGISLVDLQPSWIREHVTEGLVLSVDPKNFPRSIVKMPSTVDKYDAIYQITTLARNIHHDRALMEAVLRIHPSRGFILIEIDEGVFMPQWMFYEGFQNLNTMGQFRVFRKAFTYRIPTTLAPTVLEVASGIAG